MSYRLGVDLGTTFTAAAVRSEGRTEVFALGDHGAEIPSVVFLREDGTFAVGEAAERRGAGAPHRLAREFKRRIGDPTPLLLAGSPHSAHALTAVLLREVVHRVTAREGSTPDGLTVTHPANWGPYKRELLVHAVELADVPATVLCSEPEAAVLHYAERARLQVGDVVAVYDLGGGTFDAAVLARTDEGFEVLGTPAGVEQLGGVDFDDAVFHHVLASLGDAVDGLDPDDDATAAALQRLRRDCVGAKEALSHDDDIAVPVSLPGLHTSVRLTRDDFEDLVRPPLAETVAALRRALRSADVEPDQLAAVLLAGGSSRMPLVADFLSSQLGRPIAVDAHPKHLVALGATAYGPAPRTAASDASVATHAGGRPHTDARSAAVALAPDQRPAPLPGPPAPAPAPDSTGAARVPPQSPERPEEKPTAASRSGRRLALLAGLVTIALAAVSVAVLQRGGEDGGGGADGVPLAPELAWTFETRGALAGRPAHADGVVYVGSQSRDLFAVAADSGEQRWRFRAGGKITGTPAVVDEVVFVTSHSGSVDALRSDDGTKVWSANPGGAVTRGPHVEGGVVYVATDEGRVHALDAADGTALWASTPPSGDRFESQPLVVADKVFVGGVDGLLHVFDAATGRAAGTVELGPVFSSPALGPDGMVYVGSNDNRLSQVNPTTLEVVWDFPTDDLVSSTPWVDDSGAYVGSFDGNVYAVTLQGGERWRRQTGDRVFSSPMVADGVVYTGSHARRVLALDADDGRVLWQYEAEAIVGASPLVVEDQLFVGDDSGTLHAFTLRS